MTKPYNPNNYVFLCQSDEGYVLAQNTISDIITSVKQPDKVLGYTKDFNETCKLFTEVIELNVKSEYRVGDKISHNNQQYCILEICENIIDSPYESVYTVLVGR